MLKNNDYLKLLHDIKRVGKIIPIIRDEKDLNKRGLIAGLLIDEMDRLIEDLGEVKGKK